MSGYLSRIVRTAARSSQPLRPLAGSIFGTPAEHAQPSHLNDAPFIVETEVPAELTGASNTQRRAVGSPSSPASESFLENYQPLQPTQQTLAPTHPQPLQDNRAPFESLLMQSQGRSQATGSNLSHANPRSWEISPATEPQADSIRPQAADSYAFAARIARKLDSVPEQFTPRPGHADPTADGLNQQPERAEPKSDAHPTNRNQTAAGASHALIPAQPTQMVRPQQQPIRDQRAQPTPEPSIEIHIGRIEVLAVQPPAAPAPAPRRDRTTSLADYLAGQNGRRT